MQKNHFYIAGYLLLTVLLHVNAILKPEDPIADTQTDAISYDQKVEQDKDGVKAPATPKMIYYGGQGFLTRSSLSKYDKEISAAAQGKKKDQFNWSDWWEDKPEEKQLDQAAPQVTEESVPGLPVLDGGKEKVFVPTVESEVEENSLPNPPELPVDENSKPGDDWW